MYKPYIGIIVDGLVYGGIEHGVSYFENLAFYEEGGKQFNVIPCFFRLRDINVGADFVEAFIMDDKNGEYVLKEIPIPQIIHNRGLYYGNSAREKIKSLQDEGIIFFNEWNRYSKMTIHKILVKNDEINPHLPETVLANDHSLHDMLEKYKEIIIKPNSNSLGSGVIKVERTNVGECIMSSYNKNEKRFVREAFTEDWPPILKKKISKMNNIVQQRIPLATYKGCPFDMRVSVQRNSQGNWQVTGIVGKVAQIGGHVTNVAKGGACKTLEELVLDIPHLQYEKVNHDIEKLSIKAVRELSKHIPNLADVGLDIGITEEGFPMFIECNGRDLRITFGKANMREVWKKTYSTPIGYARYLFESLSKEGV